MSTGRSILSNLLLTLWAKIAVRILGLVVLIFQMRYLDELYGTYSMVVLYVMTLLALVDLGWSVVIVREINRTPEQTERYLANFFALETMVSTFFVLGLVAYALFAQSDPLFIRLAIPAGIGLYLGGLSRAPLGILIARQHAGWASMADLGMNLITSVATLLVIRFNGPMVAFIWINNFYYAALFVVFSLMAARIAGPLRWRIDRDIWRTLLRLGLPSSFIAGTYVLYTTLDLVMLQQMLPGLLRDLDVTRLHLTLYNVAVKYTAPLILFAEAVMLAVYPVLASKHENDPEGFRFLLNKSLKLMLGLGLPMGLGMTLLAEDIVSTLNTPDQSDAIRTLALLVWRLPLLFAYAPINHALLASGRLKTLAALNVIALAVNFFLNLWLIPKYYENGAAIATVASHATILVIYLVFRKKFFNVGMAWGDAVRLGGALAMMAGAIMLGHRVIGRASNILEIVLFVLVGACVYCASAWFFGFAGEEERPFLKREWERRFGKKIASR